ncbi:hypothetical protein J7K24_03380 [bacterium]|nr:hypothetical protein [bacterium]
MERAAERKIIFHKFVEWYFFEQPKAILKGWMNLLKFNLEFFSVFLLLKTFFSPWKRYTWSYGRGFDLRRYAEAFISNGISRGLGAVLRFFLISVGLITEFFIFLAGFIGLLLWYTWPFFLIFVMILGIKVIS